jgi:hypothetical protein
MTLPAPGPLRPEKRTTPTSSPVRCVDPGASWRISSGASHPKVPNRPATLRVVRNYMTRVVRSSMTIDKSMAAE